MSTCPRHIIDANSPSNAEVPKICLGQFYGVNWVTRHKDKIISMRNESFGVMVSRDRIVVSTTNEGRNDIVVYELSYLKNWGNKTLAVAKRQAGGITDESKTYVVFSCVDDIMLLQFSKQEYKSMTLRINNEDHIELMTLRR